jgi:polysaccharide biosynthesis protein PslH
MKVLQVCNRVPFPARDGGALAMNSITESLLAGGNTVQVMAVNTSRHYVETERLPEEYRKQTNIIAVPVDTRVKATGAFLSLFGHTSYNIERFNSPDFRHQLAHLLQGSRFDIIQLESLFVVPYLDTIRAHSDARVLLRSHNAEFRIWEQRAANTRNPLLKAWISLLARRLKTYEASRLNEYDAIIAISHEDAETFRNLGCAIPIHVTPFGVQLEEYTYPNPEKAPLSICFIGSLDWKPNLEGLLWFIENCWPLLLERIPDLRLRVAGKNMPPWLKRMNVPGTEMLGEVPSSPEFIRDSALMIVPLLSGSGMRVKIIEAMALGRPVISTRLGAEGIRYTPGENLLTADTAQEFVERIEKCIHDPGLRNAMGRSARSLVEREYSSSTLASGLTQFYNTLLRS